MVASPTEEVVMGRVTEEVAGGLQRAEDDEGFCHPPGPWWVGGVAGRQDLLWGDTPQEASCPPSSSTSHFCSLPPFPFRFCFPVSQFFFFSSFLHSLLIVLCKPAWFLSEPELRGAEELAGALSLRLLTRGLTLPGLTEELSGRRDGDSLGPKKC